MSMTIGDRQILQTQVGEKVMYSADETWKPLVLKNVTKDWGYYQINSDGDLTVLIGYYYNQSYDARTVSFEIADLTGIIETGKWTRKTVDGMFMGAMASNSGMDANLVDCKLNISMTVGGDRTTNSFVGYAKMTFTKG